MWSQKINKYTNIHTHFFGKQFEETRRVPTAGPTDLKGVAM